MVVYGVVLKTHLNIYFCDFFSKVQLRENETKRTTQDSIKIWVDFKILKEPKHVITEAYILTQQNLKVHKTTEDDKSN